MVRALPALFLVLFTVGLAASGSEQPRLVPLTGLPPSPVDNPTTPAKVRLGERLFFDNILSGERRRSCGTCHKPELLFTDGFSRAWGLHESELHRKTPNLLNVGWQRSLFFDGRAQTLEEQASKPLENRHEMDLDPVEAAGRVTADSTYRLLFEQVFPGEPITFELIARTLAAYQRTLVSYDSDLDRYLLGDESALSPAARRGMELFTGKAGCVRCHHGPLLTDHALHYTGVPEREGDSQPGAKYKTASLRDVTRRYSFMHNGTFLTIQKVFDHYSRGGAPPEGLTAEIKPLTLQDQERADLLAFLQSLNGRISDAAEDAARDYDVFEVRAQPSKESAPAASPKGP